MGNEITNTAIICFTTTLIGLSLGFALLRAQGE
uniref:Cytochrome b6-f complex subunit 7 n=1 Tax=Sciadococcus taiwanensis TaxID=3028030 RepID=A0A9Y1I293_9RHOD|nr:cytochrome b6-f complex subunit VII [Sciadococcus taiwanensis]